MIEKKELDKAEKHLNSFGYKNIIFKKINYGINSSSWKVLTKKNKFFLKFYLKANNDKRDRLGTEFKFIELLAEGGLENFPKIILTNRKDNWTLFEWLEGNKVSRPTLKDYEALILFVKSLQILKSFEKAKYIGDASEACFNLIDHQRLIITRLENIIKFTSGEEKKWLKIEVLESIKKCEKTFEKYFSLSSSNSSYKGVKILSPSDIGFHNILKIKDKLYFHDFEYAGWDDPYKLIVDILIQPENVLNKNISLKVYKLIESSLNLNTNFELLKIYLILYRAKWVSIILKKIIHKDINSLAKKSLNQKIFDYFNLVGKIWEI